MLGNLFELINQSPSMIEAWIFRVSRGAMKVSAATIQSVLDGFSLIVIIVLLIKYLIKGVKLLARWIVEKKVLSDKYIKDNVPVEFLSYIKEHNKHFYINTKIQEDTPSRFEEPKSALANSVNTDFISHFIKNVFIDDNAEERLYCILGGSGMGKSTALVNLFISYTKHYKIDNMPFKIALLSLANREVLDSIRTIDNKRKTILLLDALDENIDAVTDMKEFMSNLEFACKDFRFLVISCRTQFFPDETAQLKESKLIKDGINKGFAAYKTFYISPFSDDDIQTYIKRTFPWWKFSSKRKKKALAIIGNKACQNLMVRPMILSYIRQLADAPKEYKYAVEVFDTIVDFWLEREAGRFLGYEREKNKDLLRKLSEELAENIYSNKDVRKGYYINEKDFNVFLQRKGIDNNLIQFRERSLINRDALGYIKFAHKSFLEYFIAYQCVNENMYILDYTDMDIAEVIYQELCKKKCLSNTSNNIVFTAYKNNEYKGKIKILDLNGFKLHWLDFLQETNIVLKASQLKSTLMCDSLLWYNSVRSLDIFIDETGTEYLKCLIKLKNLESISIHGDLGQRKNALISIIMNDFPEINLNINKKEILINGTFVYQCHPSFFPYSYNRQQRLSDVLYINNMHRITSYKQGKR